MFICVTVLIHLFEQVNKVQTVAIDFQTCGEYSDIDVPTGVIEDIKLFPWYGIFYYQYDAGYNPLRVVTPVVLIQDEFVLSNAYDIGSIPKANIRSNSHVLLGEQWIDPGRRVRNYVLHPEYEHNRNTIALIQLTEGVSRKQGLAIKPICPAPNTFLINPELFIVRFNDNFEHLHKEVMVATHVPARMCRDFYVAANLYMKVMRPEFVVCSIALDLDEVCVWNAGAVLVTRDIWGRWQLLGLGVRGPGCSAPSRYIDMLSYYPWIHSSLENFRRITITKLTNQKYVLRNVSYGIVDPSGAAIIRDGSGTNTLEKEGNVVVATQRFGACDEEEKKNLLYRDVAAFGADSTQFLYVTYNMSIHQSMEITCMTLEIQNATGISEMSVRHYCKRPPNGGPCYVHRDSVFDVSIVLMFSGRSKFEMFVWGFEKEMRSLDIMEWKWEEGSFYNDFTAEREEYRGPPLMTDFGYEPLDQRMWMPNYDLWTTSSTSPPSTETEEPPPPLEILFKSTTSRRPRRTTSAKTTTTKKKIKWTTKKKEDKNATKKVKATKMKY